MSGHGQRTRPPLSSPVFSASPVQRAGEEANQALAYGRDGERRSNLASLIARAADYSLDRQNARRVVDEVVTAVREGWAEAAERAALTEVDRNAFWGRLFLNPGALHDL